MTDRAVTPPVARPRPRGTAWLAVGAVLTAVAVLAGGMTIWTSVARLSPEIETTRQTHTRPVSRVVVDAAEGILVLAPGGAGQLSFERRLEWSGSKPAVEERWDGGTFRVTVRCADGPFRLGPDPACSVGYTMEVPAETAVDIRNTSGEIEVRGLQGEVRLSETTGSVSVSDLTGSLVLHTTSGEIVGTHLRSSEVDVDVDSGDVYLGFDGAPTQINMEATSGNLSLEVPGDERYRLRVETARGRQEIGVVHDPGAGRAINIRTTSGDVRIGYGP
jgi:hypothetical protein